MKSRLELPPEPGEQIKVLMIDDDPGDARLIERKLEQVEEWTSAFGHELNAADGKRRLQKEDFDLLLLDHILPENRGMDILEWLSNEGITTPTIYLTGMGDETIAAGAIQSGADDYLPKPELSARELENSLHKIREQRIEKKAEQATLQEIHHRVKNNIELISSIIELELGEVDSPEVQSSLDLIQSRLRSIGLLHESLYESNKPATLDPQFYFREIVEEIQTIFKDESRALEIDFNVDSTSLDIDYAIPCGLIITELMSVSFKFVEADNNKRTITIGFNEKESVFELSYNDSAGSLDLDDEHDVLSIDMAKKMVTNQLQGSVELNFNQDFEAIIQFQDK